MRILMTTSAAPIFSPFATNEKRFPLGIGFLISILRENGHKVFFLDNYLSPTHFYETGYVIDNKIDAVCIYANTICFDDTVRMILSLDRLRKEGKWNGKIIVGGPHTTVAPESIPPEVDYIVQGEGEKAILDALSGREERIIRSERIMDLDALPAPAWDCFVKLPYDYTVNWFEEKPVFTLNTSRGCPFNCTFCSVGSIWGKKYTFMSAERIVDDIEYITKRYKVKGVYFREDNFTLNKKRVLQFCDLLLRRELRIKWACETRVDTLNEEMLKMMYRAGCRALYFGVESGSQKMLDFLRKGITVEQATETVRLCKNIGISTAASFIFGHPGETEEERRQTRKLIKKLDADVTWQNVFVGIPDSELYKYTLKNKLYEYKDRKGFVYPKGSSLLAKSIYGKGFVYHDTSIDRKNDQPLIIKNTQLENPKVSVILSVHNGSKHIELAINSILEQSLRNFEFIIVDDGSNDKTQEILNGISDERVMIIRQEHQGLTVALNTALNYARGEFIARMDADDISHVDRLKIQSDFLEQNTEYGLAGTSSFVINEQGKIVGKFYAINDSHQLYRVLPAENQFVHGSVMFRSSVLKSIGKFDADYKYSQDYEYWIRIAGNYKVVNLPAFLYYWRKTLTGISTSFKSEQNDYSTAIKSRAINEYSLRYEWEMLFGNGKLEETNRFGKFFNLRRRLRYSKDCMMLAYYSLKNKKYNLSEEYLKNSIQAFMLNIPAVILWIVLHLDRDLNVRKWITNIKRLLA